MIAFTLPTRRKIIITSDHTALFLKTSVLSQHGGKWSYLVVLWFKLKRDDNNEITIATPRLHRKQL